MARAEPELRPGGIAAGYVVASRHTNPSEFTPAPPKHTIGTFKRQLDRLSDGRTRRNHAHVDLLSRGESCIAFLVYLFHSSGSVAFRRSITYFIVFTAR
jgi:hypothetical protein